MKKCEKNKLGSNQTWRGLVTFSLLFFLSLVTTTLSAAVEDVGGQLVDYASFLSRNDVVYLAPAREGWQGLPIGNGNIGVMLWQPDDIMLQLNSAYSGAYNGAIARLQLKAKPKTLDSNQSYQQRLSLYDATIRTDIQYASGRLKSQVFVTADADVVVVNVSDTRPQNSHILEVETWRGSTKVLVDNDRVVITDRLTEENAPDYRFALAVASDGAKVGKEGKIILKLNESAYTIWAAFAETRDPKIDVTALATKKLAEARAKGLEATVKTHRDWWRDFWSGSLLHLHSKDGVADYLENCWYMHIYAMASGSRGPIPPKFNGGLWTYDQDKRTWGKNFWHWNQQETYWPLFAANHLELQRPYRDMYFNMLPIVKDWTKKTYCIDGAQFQETLPFHGHIRLFETVKGIHPRVPIIKKVSQTHEIYSSSAEIAMQFWWYWRYTGDITFLNEKAYPLMKNVALFFLGYLEKDKNGIYNMYPSNAHETYWRVKNPTTDLAGIHYLFPRVIKAAEILNVDPEFREQCANVLSHLAPYPIDHKTGSLLPYELQPKEIPERRNAENPRLFPIGVFPLMLPGTPNYNLALKSFRFRDCVNFYGWNTDAISAARLGLADNASTRKLLPDWNPNDPKCRGLDYLLPEHVKKYQIYPCGLMDFHLKPQIIYLEGSGTATTALNEMLLQSWYGLLRTATALPATWDARFTLAAMGGFLVSAQCTQGIIDYIIINSKRGGKARLLNPFEKALVLNDNKTIIQCDKPIIEFDTVSDGRYIIVPANNPEATNSQTVLTGKRNDTPKQLGKRWIGIPPKTED